MQYLQQWFRDNRRDVYIGLFLAVLVFGVYGRLLEGGFFSDDYDGLYTTGHQRGVWQYFFTNQLGVRGGHTYGPFLNLFFTIEYWLFGVQAMGFHAVNFLLHLATAWVVYLFARALTGEWWLGALSASWFAVMQSHTSVLAWVSGLTHLLATLLFLLSIYTYYVFVVSGRRGYYVAALVAALLSLLTKEIGISFLVVWLLIELLWGWEWKRLFWSIKKTVVHFVLPVLLLGVYFLARWYATGYVLGYYGQHQLSVNGRAMVHMLIELTVNFFVSFPLRREVTLWLVSHLFLVSVVALGLCVFLVWHAQVWRRCVLFLIVSYVVAALPFLQLSFHSLHDGGERYTYLLSTFTAIALPLFLLIFFRRLRLPHMMVGFVMGALIASAIVIQQPKIERWQVGSRVVTNILDNARQGGVDHTAYTLFVGLPESVDGAEIFRNAIREAIALSGGISRPPGERILMNTMLTVANVDLPIVTVRQVATSTYTLNPSNSGERLFTGFPLVEHELATFQLANFRLSDHTGTHIMMTVHEEAIKKLRNAGQDVHVVYYSHGRLQRLVLE